MFCWLYFIQLCSVKKTETGSASGPVLFTSCEMVYIETLDILEIKISNSLLQKWVEFKF